MSLLDSIRERISYYWGSDSSENQEKKRTPVQESFKETIKKGITLVDFYADWCRYCPRIIPHLETIAVELQEQASIAKLDIAHAKEIASTYQIIGVPTLILFRDGAEVGRLVGVHKPEVNKAFILTAKK